MLNTKHLSRILITIIVLCCLLLTSACSQRYSGSSAGYGTTSDYSSDIESYEDDSDNNSSDYDDEDSYYEDTEEDSDSESMTSKKVSSGKKTTNNYRTTKTTKTTKTVKKTNNNSYQNTNSAKESNKSDWLHKDYYNYGNSIGEAEFGSWYDRAPITRKPYTTFDDIPDSDYICTIYSGDHYFRLGETNGSSSLVYYKGKTGYLCDTYTLSSATYYDHAFSYNAPGVELKKYNDEWVAYKNGPVTDYCGICPYEGTYWLISQGKVRTDISTIIHVYYDEGNNQKEAYLVIDEGEMVAIKSANNIVLWSN